MILLHFHLNIVLVTYTFIQLTAVASKEEKNPREHKTVEEVVIETNENARPSPSIGQRFPSSDSPVEQSMDASRPVGIQLFEGDITLDDDDKDLLLTQRVDEFGVLPDDGYGKRTIHRKKNKLWPSPDIPIEIVHTNVGGMSRYKFEKQIRRALIEIMNKSCITFRWKTKEDKNWILFYDGYGCHSGLGRKTKGGSTHISIGKGCTDKNVIIHQIFHAMGFLHEQSRVDRKRFIQILWENIKHDHHPYFDAHGSYDEDQLKEQYDFNSILHFPRDAWAKTGSFTIISKIDPKMELGGEKMSKLDIYKLRNMFHCKASVEWSRWSSWSQCSVTCAIGYRTRTRSALFGPQIDSELRACRLKKCFKNEHDNSFEYSWGCWQRKEWDCKFEIKEGKGINDKSGPETDHTSGKGRFASLQSGRHCQKGAKAGFECKVYNPKGDKCLDFFYNMRGKGMGRLRVSMQFTGGSSIELWRKVGDQGDGWQEGATTVPSMNEQYTLSFEATVGELNLSDMGIDDIFLDGGKCISEIEGCNDYAPNRCKKWVEEGECFKNSHWMLRGCCRSCSDLGDCSDLSSRCKVKAQEGRCKSNSKEMWRKCCSSCNDCLDKDSLCSAWAKDGACMTSSWMQHNCKISCGICREK